MNQRYAFSEQSDTVKQHGMGHNIDKYRSCHPMSHATKAYAHSHA